jgi:hypothetical protein
LKEPRAVNLYHVETVGFAGIREALLFLFALGF